MAPVNLRLLLQAGWYERHDGPIGLSYGSSHHLYRELRWSSSISPSTDDEVR